MGRRRIPAHGVCRVVTGTNGLGLRVAPGKYGYKWAKWVVRIELVAGSPKGYWEQRGCQGHGAA